MKNQANAFAIYKSVFLIVIALTSGFALAQGATPPASNGTFAGILASISATLAQGATPPASKGTFAGILENISATFDYVVNNSIGGGFASAAKGVAVGLANQTVSLAYSLAGTLAAISIFWKGTVSMLEKKSIIPVVMEIVIFAGVSVFVITNYGKMVDQVWSIGEGLLGSIAGGSGVAGALKTYITTFFGAMGTIYKGITASWDQVGLLQAAGMIVDVVGTVLMLIGITFMMIMSIVDIIGVFVMGPIFFAVGVVFGPIMIATLNSDFTRRWFDQWLNFLVSSAMLTVVAATVLVLLSQTAGAAAARFTATPGGGMLALLGLGILTMSLSKLFQAVPAITDAIFPGRTSAGSAINNKDIASGIAKAAMGITGLGMAAKAAQAAPGQAAGAIVAGLNAKTHMTNGLASAGASVASGLKSAADGARDFARDVQNSDAGRSITDLAKAASASAKSTANGMSAGGNQGAFNSRQVQNMQQAFNNRNNQP